MRLIFCSDPLAHTEPDSAFAREAKAARDLGMAISLVDHQALIDDNDRAAVRKVAEDVDTEAVYRGWMLRPEAYHRLYDALARRGLTLVNDPDAYRHAHWLPESYAAIAGHTPKTVWTRTSGDVAIDAVMELIKPFGDAPLIVKDFVKSQKHAWEEACFIPSASDRGAVERVVKRFLALQGDDLAEGLVFREHVALAIAGKHPKSGMPLAREYRIFFLDGAPIATFPYWDEIAYPEALPDFSAFHALAAKVKSRFFTMDLAELRGGGFTVLELGDGQVAGLPERADARAFYEAIKKRVR